MSQPDLLKLQRISNAVACIVMEVPGRIHAEVVLLERLNSLASSQIRKVDFKIAAFVFYKFYVLRSTELLVRKVIHRKLQPIEKIG